MNKLMTILPQIYERGGGGGGSPLRWPNIRAGGGGGGGRPNDAYMSAACVKKYNFTVNLLCVSSNTFGREIYKFQA